MRMYGVERRTLLQLQQSEQAQTVDPAEGRAVILDQQAPPMELRGLERPGAWRPAAPQGRAARGRRAGGWGEAAAARGGKGALDG